MRSTEAAGTSRVRPAFSIGTQTAPKYPRPAEKIPVIYSESEHHRLQTGSRVSLNSLAGLAATRSISPLPPLRRDVVSKSTTASATTSKQAVDSRLGSSKSTLNVDHIKTFEVKTFEATPLMAPDDSGSDKGRTVYTSHHDAVTSSGKNSAGSNRGLPSVYTESSHEVSKPQKKRKKGKLRVVTVGQPSGLKNESHA